MQAYIERYHPDSCGYNFQDKKRLKEDFEGFKPLSDINGDGKNDTLFIVPPFSMCDYDGRSYYFTDTSLPRLYTDTFCNWLKYFFVLPDIDEDGIKEIGFYYSSCASRYKSLCVYSLKNDKWDEIALAGFDIGTKDPEKIKFEDLVKKTGKNKFKVCEFMEGKTTWKSYTMK